MYLVQQKQALEKHLHTSSLASSYFIDFSLSKKMEQV
jgi:hypothetical protein